MEIERRTVFASKLGWMALRMRSEAVCELSFGYTSAAVASKAVGLGGAIAPGLSLWQREVVEQLVRYAEGEAVEFSNLPVDPGPLTEFNARVLKACREISYGQTVTYGELAAAAGHPGAARAVGNCMASNRVPLIIPCHRVVRAGGDIGPYSAIGGSATKRRLLRMEIANSLHPLPLV
jgi:methylated-DNA-[protein]-cysteine S-methyltransferase